MSSARDVVSARYAVLSFEFTEEIFCRPGAPVAYIFQALADAFARVSLRGNVEEIQVLSGSS